MSPPCEPLGIQLAEAALPHVESVFLDNAIAAAGIYYRALLGPFASAKKAAKLCRGLKAAGDLTSRCPRHRLEGPKGR